MSASAPVSSLTTDQLLRLSVFNRTVADQLDDAFVLSTSVASAADFVIDSGMLTTNTAEQNRAALQAALVTAANFGGCRVRVRAKTGVSETVYSVGRNGNNPYAIDIPGNYITMEGDRGVWLQFPVGLPAATVALIRIDTRDRVTIRDIGIDGNWGNSVGGTDSDVGINHASHQGNPLHFGIHVRGSTNVTVSNVDIRQVYGDGIETIASSVTGAIAKNVYFDNITVDMCARHAFSFSNGAEDVHLSRFKFTNIYAGTFDTEPVGTFKPTRNVTISKGYVGRWWSLVNFNNRVTFSVVGSDSGGGATSAVRNFHVSEVTIDGPTLIGNVRDCSFDRCRFIADYAVGAYPPIRVDHTAEGFSVTNSYVYDRDTVGSNHPAAIQIVHYGTIYRPGRVVLKNLRIDSKNGQGGIVVDGAGGVRSFAGTSSVVTATTLKDNGAPGWTVNQFAGGTVRVGTTHGQIATNTSDTLTIYAWFTAPFGSSDVAATTPSPGAYVIMGKRSEVIIDDCSVDCTDDGYGAGGVGLYIDAGDIQAIPGNLECKVQNFKAKNATGDAVQVQSRNGANPIRLLVLDGVDAVDDQPTPTCTTAVRFLTSPAVNITKILMRNVHTDGVAATFTGVGTASPNLIKWLIKDGQRQEWEGFGAPTFSASIGTRYWRLDPTNASTTLYINNDGATTWTAK